MSQATHYSHTSGSERVGLALQQFKHMPADGDLLHLRTGRRDQPPKPEEAEITVLQGDKTGRHGGEA